MKPGCGKFATEFQMPAQQSVTTGDSDIQMNDELEDLSNRSNTNTCTLCKKTTENNMKSVIIQAYEM